MARKPRNSPKPVPQGPSNPPGPPWSGGGSFPKVKAGPGGGGGPIPAYPILTEEVGYPPSPIASSGTQTARSGNGGRGAGGRGAALGPVVSRALQDVLGWKINGGDAKGFLGALNQSFQLTMVEGHVQSTWTPRSYAVTSDLAGGISGAQASLYTMAKSLLDKTLPIIDGLYPLDPAADLEYVAAIKQLANSQLTELVNELAFLGGPRVVRVHQYFQMLLGVTVVISPPDPASTPPTPAMIAVQPVSPLPSGEPPPPLGMPTPWTDPDGVLGTLGNLRDQLGLAEPTFATDIEASYINSIADEQNVTNFRILVDYANSLLNSWTNSFAFFYANTSTPFLGTQLVLISRQLGVISETVDEVRFVLDSVFIGPSARQTYVIPGQIVGSVPLTQIFLEDMLSWIQDFVTDEAPAIIQTGGRLALGQDFAAMINDFVLYAYGTLLFAQDPANSGSPIATDRVQFSLAKLSGQLYELYTSALTVGLPYLRTRA